MAKATLDAYLTSYAGGDKGKTAVAEIIRSFAEGAAQLRRSINEGALGVAFAAARNSSNAGGDDQKDLDVFADDLFIDAARRAGAACIASEELPSPVMLNEEGTIAIATDPLDGSSNIDTNVSIGTIFSLLPYTGDMTTTFAQPGTSQIAAGFFIYGPQLALALTLGNGTSIFVFSARLGTFVEAYSPVTIAQETKEFAINASNYRHWDQGVRLYVDDCLAGASGPREKDFNMRWIASLVADSYRIFIRGGVFLYPGDTRKGYSQGRLRLVYEANPVAFLAEQAGGAATDGRQRIMEIQPRDLHQRTPLIFGSAREVAKIGRYFSDPATIGNRHPLFGNRGLFRA